MPINKTTQENIDKFETNVGVMNWELHTKENNYAPHFTLKQHNSNTLRWNLYAGKRLILENATPSQLVNRTDALMVGIKIGKDCVLDAVNKNLKNLSQEVYDASFEKEQEAELREIFQEKYNDAQKKIGVQRIMLAALSICVLALVLF